GVLTVGRAFVGRCLPPPGSCIIHATLGSIRGPLYDSDTTAASSTGSGDPVHGPVRASPGGPGRDPAAHGGRQPGAARGVPETATVHGRAAPRPSDRRAPPAQGLRHEGGDP